MAERGRKLKVLLLSEVPETALQVLTESAGYEVEICAEALTEAQLAKRIEEVNVVGLSDRHVEVLTDEIIRSAHRLLAIGCFCADASAVDVKCASEMGVPVFTSPYGDSHSRAETVIALVVLLARQLGDRNYEMHRTDWQKVSENCYEVRGKKLGIIGYGHVGSQLGVLAEFLGLKVIWYDRQPLMPIGNSEPVASMEALLREADFVSVQVSQVPENTRLIGAEQIALMKRGSYLISTSYAEAVDLDAVAAALQSGQLAGAAVDVFPETALGIATSGQRQLRPDLPLLRCANVILTPGICGATADARARVGVEMATYLDRYIKEGCTQGSVNFPVVETRPVKANNRRIINIHKNVRGILTEINHIVSMYNINKQVSETRDTMGYVLIDVNTNEVTSDIVASLAMLSNSVRTRCV